MRRQKGITLIALVVTIIVLLILAGVTIAMLSGQNGVLTNAQKARRETSMKETEEKINLTLNSLKTEIFAHQVEDKNYSGLTTEGGSVTAVDQDILAVIKNDMGLSDTPTVIKRSAATGDTPDIDASTLIQGSTIKSGDDEWHFYLDDYKSTADTNAGSSRSDTFGVLTIAYKNTSNNYYTYGRIVLSNTTTQIALKAATSDEIAAD